MHIRSCPFCHCKHIRKDYLVTCVHTCTSHICSYISKVLAKFYFCLNTHAQLMQATGTPGPPSSAPLREHPSLSIPTDMHLCWHVEHICEMNFIIIKFMYINCCCCFHFGSAHSPHPMSCVPTCWHYRTLYPAIQFSQCACLWICILRISRINRTQSVSIF